MFKVSFTYFEGSVCKDFDAHVFSLPRKGEWIWPDRGRPVIVDHVVHRMGSADGEYIVAPLVILRQPSHAEEEASMWIIRKNDDEQAS
jgi:hypothetical protein